MRGWTPAIDVWSIGTVAAELYMGDILFHSQSLQESLAAIYSLCGRFPLEMIPKHLGRYFDEEGNVWNADELIQRQTAPKQHQVNKLLLKDIFRKEDFHLANVVRSMLMINPEARASMAEVVRSPFFN